MSGQARPSIINQRFPDSVSRTGNSRTGSAFQTNREPATFPKPLTRNGAPEGAIPLADPSNPSVREINRGYAVQVLGLEKELAEWKLRYAAKVEEMANVQSNHKDELGAQEHKYTIELQNAAKQREDLMNNHAIELAEAKSQLVALKQKSSLDLDQLRGNFSAEKSQAVEGYNTAVEALKDEHSQELSQLNETHRANFDELQQSHVTDLERLTREHAEELARVTRQLQETQTLQNNRIRDQEASHASRVSDLTATSSNLRARHESATNELTHHREMLTEAEQKITELTTKNQALDMKLMAASASASAAMNEIAELKRALNDASLKLATQEQKERLQAKMNFKGTEDLEYELATVRKEKIALRNQLNDIEAIKGEQLERDRRKWMKYYEEQITSAKMEVKNLIEARSLSDTAFANERNTLMRTAAEQQSKLERQFKQQINVLSNELVEAKAQIQEIQSTADKNASKNKADLLTRTVTHENEIQKLKTKHRSEMESATRDTTKKLTSELASKSKRKEDFYVSEKNKLAAELRALKEELKTANGKVDRAGDLERQLEELKRSSIAEKQNALRKLESELQDQHQNELIRVRTAHETEISTLNSAHEAEVVRANGRSSRVEEVFRSMKQDCEREKQEAVDQAVMELRGF